MELYQAYTDYHGMMDLTENLYRHVAQEVLGKMCIRDRIIIPSEIQGIAGLASSLVEIATNKKEN